MRDMQVARLELRSYRTPSGHLGVDLVVVGMYAVEDREAALLAIAEAWMTAMSEIKLDRERLLGQVREYAKDPFRNPPFDPDA